MENKDININISTTTILKVILLFFSLYILYLIRDVLAILFVAIIFSSAIGPWVDWMQRKRIPRSVGMVFIYLVLFFVVGSVIFLIIPPIIEQFNEISRNFPAFMQKSSSLLAKLRDLAPENIFGNFEGGFSSFKPDKIYTTVFDIFGSIISLLLILVITFYMSVEENAMRKIIWSVAPSKYQSYIIQLANRMQAKIGLWLRGQLILSLIIFLLTFIGLSILGVKYALILALIAGLTEFVPYLGPILAAVPAIFLSFTQSPNLALIVLVLYYLIQWTENNIVVPNLMQKVVGLNPVIIIVVLLIGFKIAGIMGAILAIPVATAASVFVKDIFDTKVPQGH